MKRLVVVVIVLSFFLFNSENSKAQLKNIGPNVPSPNASGLGLYGEMPVSYFTGIPSISIPLYEVKGNQIKLPLTMNYYAAGLRPESHPGWVGNGWSLSAGGVITRKPNGYIDENYKPTTGKQGYYFNYKNLNASNWSSKAGLNQSTVYPLVNPSGNPGELTQDSDTEPDEFDFNFLGFSGKFFLTQTGEWKVQSDQYLKVVFDPNDFVKPFVSSGAYPSLNISTDNVCKTFGRFTLIDGNGTKYVFGSDPVTDPNNTAIEFSDIMVPSRGSQGLGESFTANSWYLSKIISADNVEIINLNYERGPFTSYIGSSFNATGIIGKPGDILNPGCVNSSAGRYTYSGRIVSPVYLVSIDMPSQNIKLDFSKSRSNEMDYELNGTKAGAYVKVYNDAGYSGLESDFPSIYLQDFAFPKLIPYFASAPADRSYINRIIWLRLNSFRVMNTATNSVIRSFNFEYDSDINKRLQLNYLNIKDKVGVLNESYSFIYNKTPLPKYLLTYTDHWGFNNNITQLNAGFTDFDSLRAPDQSGIQTQAEVLTDIIYPTGGRTTFIYEPNAYSSSIKREFSLQPTAENGTAGGLRIRKIISSDNKSGTLTKEYFYVSRYAPDVDPATALSSGVLDSKPNYNYTLKGTDLNNVAYTYSALSSNSVIPLTSNSSGSHIGYSTVIEKRSDGGYTRFDFTNHDNGYGDSDALNSFNRTTLNYYQWTSNVFKRGKPLDKIDYSSNGNKVSRTITTYPTTFPDENSRAVLTGRLLVCNSGARVAVSRTAYLIPYYSFFPSEITQNSYDLNNTLTTSQTTNYIYDGRKNIIQESFLNSKGNVQKITYKYPYNFGNGDAISTYDFMNNFSMNNNVVEQLSIINVGGTEYLTAGTINTFKEYPAQKIYRNQSYNFESVNPVPLTSVEVTKKLVPIGGNLNFDNRFKLSGSFYYDDKGNLSAFSNNVKNVSGFIWDYNKTKPVAKVSNPNNVNNPDIAYSSFEYVNAGELESGTGNWTGIFLNNIKSGGATGKRSYYLDGTSSLSKANLSADKKYIVSYWSKNGAYQVSGELSVIKKDILASGWGYFQHVITGGTNVSINGTGYIDELRLYPADSEMTTYTYEPFAGISSETDPKQITTYYEFDNFQRLKSIKDQFSNIVKSFEYNLVKVADPKPVISNLSVVGKTVTVSFIAINDCSATTITRLDLNTSDVSNSTGACQTTTSIVPSSGHTYRFTITSYSSFYPSGITSDPMDIYVP